MTATVNQFFIPSFNALHPNIVNKVTEATIIANQYTSPWEDYLQRLETGLYLEEKHINPTKSYLQETVSNSEILNNRVDDIATAYYPISVDLVFPSTVREYAVRQGSTLLENVFALIEATRANVVVSLQYKRNELVKQMLFNAYQYGMLSAINVPNPLANKDNSAQVAIELNTLIDDFRTEINPRYTIYNNMVEMTPDRLRRTITNGFPIVIIFNKYVRTVEFLNALNLALISKFRGGNSNQDWQSRMIYLNLEDFPTKIPKTPRSEVTGENVLADDINFYEMPTDDKGKPLFDGKPKGGKDIVGFVLDPKMLKLCTSLEISTQFYNPASLNMTTRNIYEGIMSLGFFNKGCVITTDLTPQQRTSTQKSDKKD